MRIFYFSFLCISNFLSVQNYVIFKVLKSALKIIFFCEKESLARAIRLQASKRNDQKLHLIGWKVIKKVYHKYMFKQKVS